jgi:hemerythrin superfamily protein
MARTVNGRNRLREQPALPRSDDAYASTRSALMAAGPVTPPTWRTLIIATEAVMGLFGSSEAKQDDAIALLTADHRNVKELFDDFESTKDQASNEEKAALVQQICVDLTIHAMLEEELFYPAVRKAIDDDDLLDEAEVEHATAKALIADLITGRPGMDQFEAKVTVLGEYIQHHVKEEENEMFPKARKAVDTEALGRKLAQRKAQLLDEMTAASDGAGRAPRRSSRSQASARR